MKSAAETVLPFEMFKFTSLIFHIFLMEQFKFLWKPKTFFFFYYYSALEKVTLFWQNLSKKLKIITDKRLFFLL